MSCTCPYCTWHSPKRTIMEEIALSGRFTYEIRDKDGNLKAKGKGKNAATTAGRNFMLNVFFRSTAASANWYCGLITNASFSAFAATDTMSSHSGWTESTAYDEANRVQWSPAAASSSVVANAAGMVFTISVAGDFTCKGIFIVDNSTKGGSTGTLWATGAFDSTQAVVAADTLTITYETELQAAA